MKKKIFEKHKKTIHDYIWRFIQIFGKQGTTFLIFILSSKMLTPSEFGIYNYVFAFIFFLIMFGDFGISTATSKYVAEYNVKSKNKIKLIIFNSALLIFCLVFIIAIIVIIFGPIYLKDKLKYVLYLLPLLFLAPMTSLYDGIYRGLKKFKRLALISIPISIVSIGIIYFFIKSYGLVGALIAQNIFYFLLLSAISLGYRNVSFKLDTKIIKKIGKYSLLIGLATVGYYLFSKIDILILGHYNYIEEIATYALLNKIFAIVLIPFSIFAAIISPRSTEFFAKKNYKKILKKFKRYSLIFISIAVIFTFLAYLISPILFSIFFNEYYNNIFFTMLLPVILIYSLLVYSNVITHGLIIATGYAKIITYSNLLLGIFNIFLSIILINHIGYIGVIYASLILHIIAISSYHLIYYSKIKKLVKKNE